MKIGVTAPGSSTNMFVNILLAKPDDVAIIGVGATAGAVAIVKRGEIDAISNLDPVISLLEAEGAIVPVLDTRNAKGMQEVYGGAYAWFPSGKIYPHLAITLWETVLGFAIGSVLGLVVGLWLALSPTASALAEPYIAALNAMPRVILAPIFAVWFGLGVLSKVALGVTLVFFIAGFSLVGSASALWGRLQPAGTSRQAEA